MTCFWQCTGKREDVKEIPDVPDAEYLAQLRAEQEESKWSRTRNSKRGYGYGYGYGRDETSRGNPEHRDGGGHPLCDIGIRNGERDEPPSGSPQRRDGCGHRICDIDCLEPVVNEVFVSDFRGRLYAKHHEVSEVAQGAPRSEPQELSQGEFEGEPQVSFQTVVGMFQDVNQNLENVPPSISSQDDPIDRQTPPKMMSLVRDVTRNCEFLLVLGTNGVVAVYDKDDVQLDGTPHKMWFVGDCLARIETVQNADSGFQERLEIFGSQMSTSDSWWRARFVVLSGPKPQKWSKVISCFCENKVLLSKTFCE